jgi:hypothetical protein
LFLEQPENKKSRVITRNSGMRNSLDSKEDDACTLGINKAFGSEGQELKNIVGIN